MTVQDRYDSKTALAYIDSEEDKKKLIELNPNKSLNDNELDVDIYGI